MEQDEDKNMPVELNDPVEKKMKTLLLIGAGGKEKMEVNLGRFVRFLVGRYQRLFLRTPTFSIKFEARFSAE